MSSSRLAGTGLLAALLTCALAACTALRWDKPGLDAAALDGDIGECRSYAYLGASRYGWFPYWPMFVGRDRAGRMLYARPFWDPSERFFLEQDLFHACMKYRGYQLVPVEAAAEDEGGRMKEGVK